jgi:hypothetical protein
MDPTFPESKTNPRRLENPDLPLDKELSAKILSDCESGSNSATDNWQAGDSAHHMNDIPSDIYERVREIAADIVNASEIGDDFLMSRHQHALRAYYDEQTESGREHPFLTESVADYTDDPVEAVRLYKLALEQSREHPDEPVHTKMICLAEKLIELGREEQAAAFLRDGRAEAVRCHDAGWIADADELLQRLAD